MFNSNNSIKSFLLCIPVFLMGGFSCLASQENPFSVSWPLKYNIHDSVDNYGNQYITAWSQHPSVLTFGNNDGSITVCSSDEKTKTTYIYEFSINPEKPKNLSFKNELGSLGAFTKDDEGNYYFFYAAQAAGRNDVNMAMVKYNLSGEKINTYKLKADLPESFGGIKEPFHAGTCRLELSGSFLMVYFARKRFDGHQASYGFVLDKETFKRIDKGYVYFYRDGSYEKSNNLVALTGHSFNQFILPVEGGFVTASHGDAYPRAFAFAKFQDGINTKRLNAFTFSGSSGQNATYAEMGGLAKTSAGYIFSGTYGRDSNSPRNLFILTFDENLNSYSSPIYLTKYSKQDGHAGHPKIVSIGSGRYLLIWELFKFSTQSANVILDDLSEYLSTFMLVIDEKGAPVSEIRELKGIRLNMNDVLRYNAVSGKVYWAINDSDNSILLYALDVFG